MTRVGAVVQCTASDLYAHTTEPTDYCIDVALRCGLFDAVVLAVPDLPESAVYDALAARWGVALVKGAVFDVGQRLLDASTRHGLDVVCRLLLRRFYLDTDLVRDMVALLARERADYVRLPVDFNYELGADVFTRAALARVVAGLSGEGHDVAARRFAPWRVLDEDRARFRTVEHPGSAPYARVRVEAIKSRLDRLLGENQVQYGWQFPASAYAFLAPHLPPGGAILDVACGQGEGARRLAETGAPVVGVDLDAAYIEGARRRFGGIANLSYVHADALAFSAPARFGAIVSMHTLEHLPDPPRFLARCAENLAPGGRFFLEVPLLLPRPLGEPLYPFHTKEFLLPELLGLVEQAGFRVERAFGRDRGVYCELAAAREAVQLHCVR